MIGYKKPEELKTGMCFLCGNECAEGKYCHFECALAYSEKKSQLLKEAKNGKSE
jgi:hypothetical protein